MYIYIYLYEYIYVNSKYIHINSICIYMCEYKHMDT